MNLVICAILFGILQHNQQHGAIGERVVSQELSPYLELVLCPGRQQPWNCARDQTARLLDEMNDIVKYQWQMLKVEADKELNTTSLQRGFSSSNVKEKPSTLLKKIEIGTNFIQNMVEHTTDAMMGRETDEFEEDDDDDDDDDDEDEEEDNEINNINNSMKSKDGNLKPLEESKKKGQVTSLQPAIVLLSETQKPHGGLLGGHGGGGHGHLGGHFGGHGGHFGGHGGHGLGHKIKNKKKKKHPFGGLLGGHGGGGGSLTSLFHHDIGTNALSFLEDLLDSGVSGKPHTHGLSSINYGRSIGVGRGKKKKKKALMKLMLIGTVIKGKIELLLKVLSAHLQVKFFAIALVGLIINIARFWIDIRRGGAPQKVIYYEHAHHQHHYEDHGNVAAPDDWTAGTGPSSNSGYWKRSLGDKKREAKSIPPSEETSSSSYANSPIYGGSDQYSAAAYNSDPSYLAYSSHLPSYY